MAAGMLLSATTRSPLVLATVVIGENSGQMLTGCLAATGARPAEGGPIGTTTGSGKLAWSISTAAASPSWSPAASASAGPSSLRSPSAWPTIAGVMAAPANLADQGRGGHVSGQAQRRPAHLIEQYVRMAGHSPLRLPPGSIPAAARLGSASWRVICRVLDRTVRSGRRARPLEPGRGGRAFGGCA
jgi:hypothetical protein